MQGQIRAMFEKLRLHSVQDKANVEVLCKVWNTSINALKYKPKSKTGLPVYSWSSKHNNQPYKAST